MSSLRKSLQPEKSYREGAPIKEFARKPSHDLSEPKETFSNDAAKFLAKSLHPRRVWAEEERKGGDVRDFHETAPAGSSGGSLQMFAELRSEVQDLRSTLARYINREKAAPSRITEQKPAARQPEMELPPGILILDSIRVSAYKKRGPMAAREAEAIKIQVRQIYDVTVIIR